MENLKLPLYFKDLRRKRHLHLRHCKYQHPHPLQQNTKAKFPEPLCILTRSWLCCSSATSPLLSWNIAAPSIAAAQASPTHIPGVAQITLLMPEQTLNLACKQPSIWLTWRFSHLERYASTKRWFNYSERCLEDRHCALVPKPESFS